MARSRGVVERAFEEAKKTALISPEDLAMVALGRKLAQFIDALQSDAESDEEGPSMAAIMQLKALSAEYRQVLAALGMSPAARSSIRGRGHPAGLTPPAPEPDSPLDELKRQRAKRQHQGKGS